MTHACLRSRAWRLLAGALLAVLVCGPARAQATPERFVGRRLADALDMLRSQGLRVVFTSELVTSTMRVLVEPREPRLRDKLSELLRPHGLGAVDGPGGTVMVVRQRGARADSRQPREPARPESPPATPEPNPQLAGTHQERVTVEATPDLRSGPHPLPHQRLSSSDLERFGGYAVNDPLRAVQALPGVAVGDDFRSDLSVRASLPRHASLIVDGVAAPWLQHAALGRGDAGTVTMLGTDVVDEAALHVGGYARLDGSQIGPQLNLTLREGSRSAARVRVGAGTTGASASAEGPLGARGSWLVGLRKSYVEWPVGRQDHQRTVFGYADVQSKLVYDLRPTDELTATVVAGVSNIERDDPRPLALADGTNRSTLASLTWRSIVGSGTVLRQQVSVQSHDFANRDNARRVVNDGSDGAAAYRVDLVRPIARALFEAGAQVRRMEGSRQGAWLGPPPVLATSGLVVDVDTSWLERSGHLSVRWEVAPGLTVAPGVRMSHSTLVRRRALDRWIEVQWSRTPRWLVHGNAAIVHQFADLEHAVGWTGPPDLAPERARHLEIGLGQQLTSGTRWRATFFWRRERNLLSASGVWPLVEDDRTTVGAPARYEGMLTGSARGVELLLDHRPAKGFSGWLAYSYGVARHTDEARRDTFRADRDQRHAFTASAAWPLPAGTRLGLTFRAAGSQPIPGYLVTRGDGLYLGARRNQALLPAYARLDARAERQLVAGGRRVALFGEVLNVLNHANYGLASAWLVPDTREVTGATERLYPRLFTLGVRVEF
ncbi:MAG: TonB-dependent receptor [Acidobacteriota bacterium]|nr:TonB-dependent receptor [Acidobacteriota bacterium]